MTDGRKVNIRFRKNGEETNLGETFDADHSFRRRSKKRVSSNPDNLLRIQLE